MGQAEAAKVDAYSRVDFPCQSAETWIPGLKVPKPIIDIVTGVKHDSEGAVAALIQGGVLKEQATSLEIQGLAEYVINRAFLDLGLVHLANQGFNSITALPVTVELQGIRLAALGCLNQIHLTHASIRISSTIPTQFAGVDVRKIWPDQRKQLWEAMVSALQRKYAEKGLSADTTAEQSLLSYAGPYLDYAHITQDTLSGNSKSAIAYYNRVLEKKDLPKSLEGQRDALQLNLARIYYNDKNYSEAIKSFDKVSHESNLLTQALIGKAWSHLMMNEGGRAVGAAFGLIVGELKNAFEPDAAIVAAITYFENCHYAEALKSVAIFRKKYDRSYRWLYRWYNKEKAGKGGVSLYTELTNVLSGKKSELPPQIISEWVRSPIFLAWQQEINLVFDEIEMSQKFEVLLDQGIRSLEKKQKISDSISKDLNGRVQRFLQGVPELQKALTAGVEHELGFLNRYMISRWVDSYENSQFVEVEIYNATGEKILQKGTASKKGGAKAPGTTQRDSSGMPVLEWGSFEVNDEKAETWEDEVGFFKSNITQLCVKKK